MNKNHLNASDTSSLSSLFGYYKNKYFIFVEPGGNCGDYLIYKGAEKLGNSCDLKYKAVKTLEFLNNSYPTESVVYIHGSGGFVPWWSGSPILALKKALSYYTGPIIIGPSTFHLDYDYINNEIVQPILEKGARDVTIFCRELSSYNFMKDNFSQKIKIFLDNDTALSLCASDILSSVPSGSYTAYFIREDKESILNVHGLKPILLDPGTVTNDFQEWVKLHANAKKIITNRLHSSILGTILGKKVILLPNSYHKNRSVWEFSLKNKGVLWQDSLVSNKYIQVLLAKSFVRQLSSSYKLNALFKKYYYGV